MASYIIRHIEGQMCNKYLTLAADFRMLH